MQYTVYNMKKNGLFIFHKDLRLYDNTSLIKLCTECDKVYLIIILTNDQFANNKYNNIHCLRFFMDCIVSLYRQTNYKLCIYAENIDNDIDTIKICGKIIDKYKITHIGFNKDYTEYGINRDNKIINTFKDINYIIEEDFTLLKYGDPNILKTIGDVKVFTIFYNKIINMKLKFNHNTYKYKYDKFTNIYDKDINKYRYNLNKVEDIYMDKYAENILSSTIGQLSPYIRFGVLSIRYCYMFGDNVDFIRNLIWREYYIYREILDCHKYMRVQNNNIKWNYDNNSNKLFKLWQTGNTGYPLIDAIMRKLLIDGTIDNRMRLITAEFLVFYMHIYWQKGEKHFARYLTDYDITINYRNWHWVIEQPNFKIINIWTQSKKYFKDCKFIKKYVSEVEDLNNKDIHNYYEYCKTNVNKYRPYDLLIKK